MNTLSKSIAAQPIRPSIGAPSTRRVRSRRRLPSIPFKTACALLACTAGDNLFAQYTFTNDVVGTSDWNIPGNWELLGMPATKFPEKGASADIPEFTPKLSTDIVLTNLSTGNGAGIDLSGQRLTVNGTYNHASTGGLLNGTLDAGTVNVSIGLDIDNVDLDAQNYNQLANIQLLNGATLRNRSVFTIAGNFNVAASDNTNVFINDGFVEKTGGGAFSTISAFFTQTDGTVSATSGTLRFGGDTEIANGSIETSTRIILGGETALGSVSFALTDNGYVECTGPLTLNGVLTSTGNPSGLTRVQSTGGFSGGTFQLDTNAPFLLIGGSQDPMATSTNSGAFFWDAGTLYNFNNTATKPGDFAFRNYGGFDAFGSATLAGRLTNSGYVRQENQALLLASNGIFENQEGAVFEIWGGSVSSQSMATGQSIINAGEILKSDDGFSATSGGIFAPLVSTGTIRVTSDTFTLQGPATLSGTFVVDRTSSANASLILGSASTNQLAISDLEFEARSGGVCEWRSGVFTVGGTITGKGDSGLFHIRGGGVDFVVPADASASLDFPASVPVQIGADSNRPEFYLSGPLTNAGNMTIQQASIYGTSAFKNRGTIYLADTLDISSASGGQNGTFTNNGLFDISALNGNTIRLSPGGLFINGEPGGPDVNLTGGTLVIDGNAISSSYPATETQFLNQGTVIAPTFSATVSAVFEQDGSNDPVVEVQRSNLTFNRPAIFSAGILRSSYLDFATDSIPSRIQFSDSATFGGVRIELDHGGQVLLSGASDDFWTVNSTLTATGTGRVRMTSGTMTPTAGMTIAGLNCSGGTLFRLEGGLLNPVGETFANVGNLEQIGGTIGGNFTNGGFHDFNSGAVNDNYTNTGSVEWALGTITGTFSNGIVQTENVGTLLIHSAGTGSRSLTSDTTLYNWNLISQESSLSCGDRVKIENNRGVHLLSGSATIGAASGAIGHEYELNALGTLLANGTSGNAYSVALATFDLNGGRIETSVGNIAISPTTLTLDGGALVAAAGTRIALNAEPTGTGVDTILANGIVEVNPPSSSLPGALTLRAGGSLSGTGTVIAALTQEGALEPGNSPGTLAIDGSLTQTAAAVTRVELASGAQDHVSVSGEAILDGTLEIALTEGFVPAIGQTFTVLTAGSVTSTFDNVVVTGVPFLGEAVEVSYTANSVVLTYVANGPSYAEWASEYFSAAELADPLISGPSANPDGDTLPNGFEFIFGTSPIESGDVNPSIFDVVPDPAIPGNRFPTFWVPTASDRSGYTLGIQAYDFNTSPTGKMSVPSDLISGSVGGTVEIRTHESNNDRIGIFSLTATFR